MALTKEGLHVLSGPFRVSTEVNFYSAGVSTPSKEGGG